jgi:hypothetical protein
MPCLPHSPFVLTPGKSKLNFSFLALAVDPGEWSASRLGRSLPPGKDPPG